jgi:hypothetical protein
MEEVFSVILSPQSNHKRFIFQYLINVHNVPFVNVFPSYQNIPLYTRWENGQRGGKFWVFLFCKPHLWLGEGRFLGNLITRQWSGFSTMLIGEPVRQGGIGFRFISTGDNYYKTV